MKITVIGAGLLGLATTYFLQNKGHTVLLVDRQPGPGLETSYANGGMLTPSQSAPWNSPETIRNIWKLLGSSHRAVKIHPIYFLNHISWHMKFIRNSSKHIFLLNQRKNFRLAEYSLQQLKLLREKLELEYISSNIGTLKIFRNKMELMQGVNACISLEEAGIQYKTIYKDEILALEPALSRVIDEIYGGIYFPSDESGDAHLFCQALVKHFTKEVQCYFKTDVIKLDCVNNEITGVETSKGRLTSDVYVLAAGSYSSNLALEAGISLPIQPVKGYSATITLPVDGNYPKIPIVDESRHIAVTPFLNRFRIAGMAELCGYNKVIYPEQIENLVNFFKKLYPEYCHAADKADINPWTGLRPYSCDGVPVMGKTRISNLYLNTGHGHLGWTMSIGSAKAVSDLIDAGVADLNMQDYHIDRFNQIKS